MITLTFIIFLSLFTSVYAQNIFDFHDTMIELAVSIFLYLLPSILLTFFLFPLSKILYITYFAIITITMTYSVSFLAWPESTTIHEHCIFFLKTLPITLLYNILGILIGVISNTVYKKYLSQVHLESF